MTLIKWNPNKTLISDFDKVFNNFFNTDFPVYSKEASFSIAVDVKETEKEYTISADIPGLNKKDVSIEVHDGIITIKGERTNEESNSCEDYQLHERQFGSFNRSFRVPDNVLEDKIAAKFTNGELFITLPKAKEIKSEGRQIKIN